MKLKLTKKIEDLAYQQSPDGYDYNYTLISLDEKGQEISRTSRQAHKNFVRDALELLETVEPLQKPCVITLEKK